MKKNQNKNELLNELFQIDADIDFEWIDEAYKDMFEFLNVLDELGDLLGITEKQNKQVERGL